ncbi:hypothetical protein GC089_14550 [Cellulomonas sp. JZ18]|uniref:hypothetical protein n=1 Tax=Cellulomonas sp. JZ18 TaxID=2654191 RepID=UPI0012D387F0|nr:hypothetical protein [Cellulomonas sp. JZ18]QGQ20199.1 hypothetical protein GC089_14550 [Cellulomonas sp. JZ18]
MFMRAPAAPPGPRWQRHGGTVLAAAAATMALVAFAMRQLVHPLGDEDVAGAPLPLGEGGDAGPVVTAPR